MGEPVDITQFLEARIAEDEKVARKAAKSISPAMDVSREPVGPKWENDRGMILGKLSEDGYPIPLWDNEGSSTLSMSEKAAAHVAAWDPARVLAECVVKRSLIEYWGPYEALNGPYMLTIMALAYREHPDYRPEWATV